jgi:L-ascorbate metabolism protein UlaG (beta-lactamase superfamily)
MSVDITFFGHAGFLIKSGDHAVAIDPFLTGNPVATLKPEDIACTSIALTHGHADHLGDTVAIAKKNNATVFGAFELCEYCGEQGVAHIEPMNPGGKVATNFGYIALTQAFHSSSYEGQYMGMPCGVIVNINGVTLHHCGDTALFSDMKLLGEIYKPDIAMIPIGDRFTMGPELATRAAELIRPKIAIPVHYKTWPLLAQSADGFSPEGVAVREMQPGETMTFG